MIFKLILVQQILCTEVECSNHIIVFTMNWLNIVLHKWMLMLGLNFDML